MIHGLYGPDAVVEDFLTVMYRMKALGFNAVRTPISFLVWPCSTHKSNTFCLSCDIWVLAAFASVFVYCNRLNLRASF